MENVYNNEIHILKIRDVLEGHPKDGGLHMLFFSSSHIVLLLVKLISLK